VTARLLADADFRLGIVRALRKREPEVEFLPARGLIPESMPDPDVLALAAALKCVLVSHDFENCAESMKCQYRNTIFFAAI
jgi:hypothetical protein